MGIPAVMMAKKYGIRKAPPPLVPAMYVESMVDGILKGLNQQVSTLKYSVIDSGVRLLLIVTLVPRHGMAGFLFVMTVSNVLVAVLNLQRLLTVTDMHVAWRQWVIAPLLAVGVATAGARQMQNIAPLATWPPIFSMGAGALVLCGLYVLLLFAAGCLQKEDFTRKKDFCH